MKKRIIFVYQDTRKNEEDLAITPYLFIVKETKLKCYGIGFCWFHFSAAVCIGSKAIFKKTFFNL